MRVADIGAASPAPYTRRRSAPPNAKELSVQLILTGEPPIHWAVAGAGIGVITLILLWTTNHRLGISSGFEDVCSLVLKVPYLRRGEVLRGRTWRLPFLAGLVLGGVVSALWAGGWKPVWSLGVFDQTFGWGHAGKLALMFVGGLFIGFGTRLAGGCTSGHGIFGMSNFEKASLRSTVSFMVAGMVTTALIYGVLAPAAGVR
jgi:uncharacterized membrane protein YedE/YeeE